MSHTFISICAMHFYSIKKLLSNLIEVLARISFFGSTHSHNSINFFLYSVGPNRWRWTSTAYRLCPLYQSNSWKVHMSNRDIINYFMWKYLYMWFQDSEIGKCKRFAQSTVSIIWLRLFVLLFVRLVLFYFLLFFFYFLFFYVLHF